MRVAAFTRYAPRAASTRQRFVQYFPALKAAGIEVAHHPLLDDDYVKHLVSGEPYSRRRVARAYVDRFAQLESERGSDIYWVYVELMPYLPAFIERLAAIGKPIIYDFDDAFFHSYDRSSNPLIRALLGGKHAQLLKRAAACICGNAYLRDFAIQYCPDSIIVPTVVDTEVFRPGAGRDTNPPVTIGWIGSPSTWPQVVPYLPILEELGRVGRANIRIVGAGKEAQGHSFPGLTFIDWDEATEVAEIQKMDIGIMPLLDQPFERGKSGYKLIQYTACGLPVVASPVGVNSEIVIENENGFLANDMELWREALVRLIDDGQLRQRLGDNGRARVEERYSLASQAPRLIELFKAIA